jgi:hypothetical protein
MAQPKKQEKPKRSPSSKSPKSTKKAPSNSRVSILLILFLLAASLLAFALYQDYYKKERERPSPVKKTQSQPLKESSKPKQTAQKNDKKKLESNVAKPNLKEKPKPNPKSDLPKDEKVSKPVEVASVQSDAKAVKPPDAPVVKSPQKTDTKLIRPRVAIVIDDLGISKELAKELFEVEGDLTLSVLPKNPYSKWVAEEGHKRGHEIMLHAPMESVDSNKNLGQGGLYASMNDEELQTIFFSNLASVPHVVGFNNHMGSGFTQNERAMNVIAASAKTKKLFFLDSYTTAASVGIQTAKKHGLRTYKRDVFLDHDPDTDAIVKQWNALVAKAKNTGQAVGIGHPRKTTIDFLKIALPSNEVDVVPLSQLNGR